MSILGGTLQNTNYQLLLPPLFNNLQSLIPGREPETLDDGLLVSSICINTTGFKI